MELAGLVISPLLDADIPAAARLAGQLGYPSTESQIRARFERLSARPDACVLIARLEGRAVGMIHFHEQAPIVSEARLEFASLVVDEALRGRGVGGRLIAEAESWGRARGLRRVRFTSQIKREDAHRLYRRLGYEVTKTSHVFEKILS